MDYTIFVRNGNLLEQLCVINVASAKELAEVLAGTIIETGNGTTTRYRPHLIMAEDCATIAPSGMTRTFLERIAEAQNDAIMQARLKRLPQYFPQLHVGRFPERLRRLDGKDTLDAARSRVGLRSIPSQPSSRGNRRSATGRPRASRRGRQ